MGRQILLVDHQKVRAGDARPALARDFLALADRNHIDRHVGEIGREGRGEIVAAGFDEHQVEIRNAGVEIGNGPQIDRGILTDRRMRAAAGLHPDDAVR